MMKTSITIGKIAVGSLALILAAGISRAANVALNASDAVNTTSFNAAGHWNNSQAPSAANDYDTAGFFMRTPGDGVTNYTFAGNSLTLGIQNTSGGNNGSILEKFSGGAGSSRWLTINNLTNKTGALLRSGGTAGANIHIQGNGFTIAGTSAINADQCIWIIDSPLIGADNIILTNFANNANDHVSYTATNSAFTGSWYLTGAGTSAWSVQLENVNSLPGNPSTFNPGQITFLGTGQLRDIIGCSLTNSNAGITLAANGTINTSATTLIGEPITDVTNGIPSLSRLTSSGSGTLILSNANNNYSGGTTISGGTLQLGVPNAIPGASVGGDVTVNATLDLNGNNLTINGLNGATGIIDNTLFSGPATLTIGANGNNGNYSGQIQNSGGALNLVKVGAGTQIVSGLCLYTGSTVVAGGTLSLNGANVAPSTPGSLVISNASLTVDASGGISMPVGSLALGDNATNNFSYGTVLANPTAAAINVTGGVTAPGTVVVINVTATGLKTGTFPLIKYGGAGLPNLANFQLSTPPGVAATLVNNTGNKSIDISITQIPNQLSWYGASGGSWDLTSVNWKIVGLGTDTVFRQYTNGSVIAGDAVTFDDSLTNDFVNPQPTNITLNSTFSAFPVVVNSTLPYTISGTGGIAGVTSLVKSNSGSLALLTSNTFTGGVSINDTGALIITNDSALGASSGAISLNGATLQINGPLTNSRAISMPTASSIGVATNVLASLGGVISGGGASLNKIDNGTLRLTAKETITGNLFIHAGTVLMDTGSSITNGSYHDVGQNGTDNATLTMSGNASFGTTSDFNLGDLDSSTGTLNISGTATLVANQFYVGSANAGGSTASGIVNQSGGTVTEISTAIGAFAIGGRNSPQGVGVYNISGGTLNANSGIRVGGAGTGTLNINGGTVNAIGGINIARLANSIGTNNLNGGTLATFNVGTSTGVNAYFNFNGGTLQAAFNPGSPWFSGNIVASILAGGAIIDSSSNNVTISTPLLAGSPNGGLTKKGSGTLTLSGVNTFTGPITNSAGTLILNSASTYTGNASVNAGTLQLTTAASITGLTTVTNGAVLSISQVGSATATLGNLTLNGVASGLGATIALTPTSANNPAVPMLNVGALTLNGTNTISLAAVNVGTLAVLKYTSLPATTGTLTNLSLPQGATGFISNDAPNSIIYVVVTSTGPGLVWTGTNAAALNTWNIGATTNWLVNGIATSYHQIITPGDAVTFNDIGSGTVILNTNVAPASVTISNNAKAYSFSGNGNISGNTGLLKLGTGTAILSISNNNYTGDTVISNGTLQISSASSISPAANVVVGSGGTLQLNGISTTIPELSGSGIVDNNSGTDLMLTVGTAAGSTWNGSIQDHGAGALALTKNGSGTWVLGGMNRFANGAAFSVTNAFNNGTTILTNGGVLTSPTLVTAIANTGGNATVIVDGGTLAVSNNVFAVGNAGGATATLIVNNGTVFHGGGPNAAFGGANNIFIGGGGSTGTLTVNGGQVLNSQGLVLGQNATGSGTLNLNGGLVQATAVVPAATPLVSVANFNGGTLQAVTNSADFLQVTSMIMSNGLILDDGGYAVSIFTSALQAGDGFNGGLVKKGSGTLYLDPANSYTGTTLVTNGTLAGIGSVAGPLVVAPNGTLGAGDAATLGTFLAAGNITIQGKAMFRLNRDGFPQNDNIIGSANIAYGGTLVISNLSTTPLTTSDTFQLFSPATHSGNFASIVGSPGPGLAYSFNSANGVLSIVTSTIATNPTNITVSASGGNMTLTWPSDHLGWTLQSNAVSLLSNTNWFDYPPSTGSRDTTQAIIPTTSTNNVFFRLKYP